MIVSQQLLTVWNRVLLLGSRAEIPWVHGPACVVGVREERARDRRGRVLSRQKRVDGFVLAAKCSNLIG